MEKSPAGISDGADHLVLATSCYSRIELDADRLDAGYEALPGSHRALYRCCRPVIKLQACRLRAPEDFYTATSACPRVLVARRAPWRTPGWRLLAAHRDRQERPGKHSWLRAATSPEEMGRQMACGLHGRVGAAQVVFIGKIALLFNTPPTPGLQLCSNTRRGKPRCPCSASKPRTWRLTAVVGCPLVSSAPFAPPSMSDEHVHDQAKQMMAKVRIVVISPPPSA